MAEYASAAVPINLIGRSPAFEDLVATIHRIAEFDVTVSIYGETGTGKELVARSLHYLGRRCTGPFIPVNCGAIPDTLLESELFGHKRGAFTDARQDRAGFVEQAQGGTLFLDEIEALSPKGQVTLLRFLQDMQYRRVGGASLRKANLRVIVASNIELDRLRRQSGAFRDDLFYRLNVLPIRIPSLRERVDDIAVLALHFFERFKLQFDLPDKTLPKSTLHWLREQRWEGNVRELENSIQRGLLMSPASDVLPEHIEPELPAAGTNGNTTDFAAMQFNDAKTQAIAEFERCYLTGLLRRNAGNVTRAAASAGKERRALGKLLKKHAINPREFRGA